jgi:hypothetical protein
VDVVMLSPVSMVTEKLWLAVLPTESVTFTVKLALPATGVVPETTPVLDTLSPTAVRLLATEVTVHV